MVTYIDVVENSKQSQPISQYNIYTRSRQIDSEANTHLPIRGIRHKPCNIQLSRFPRRKIPTKALALVWLLTSDLQLGTENWPLDIYTLVKYIRYFSRILSELHTLHLAVDFVGDLCSSKVISAFFWNLHTCCGEVGEGGYIHVVGTSWW